MMMKTVIVHHLGRHYITFYTVENEAVRDRIAININYIKVLITIQKSRVFL